MSAPAAPPAPAALATVLAYCDVVAGLDADPYRVGAWCREHSDGSPRGLLEAARRLVDGLPVELTLPEGPVDRRAWVALADAAPRAEHPHLVRVDPVRDWERCIEHDRAELRLAPAEAVDCAGREAGAELARFVERLAAK